MGFAAGEELINLMQMLIKYVNLILGEVIRGN